MAEIGDQSFADLEQATGHNYAPSERDMWPLEEWYDKVRKRPISGLSVGDLAIALRQETWIEHVLPIALRVLRDNPVAGDLYDGELVVALKAVPNRYWIENQGVAAEAKTIVREALADFKEDVRHDAEELLGRLR